MHSINLSFVATTIEDFKAALEALANTPSVAHIASVSPPAVPTLPDTLKPVKGPYETQWEAYSGKSIRFTEGLKAEYGTRENYCYARLVEAGEIRMEIKTDAAPTPDAEFSAEDDTPPVVNTEDVKDLH